MKIKIDTEKAEYLKQFAQTEKPVAVADRVKYVAKMLENAGINAETRTTMAAMLALVFGAEEEKDPMEQIEKAQAYCQVKPEAVETRMAKIRELVEKGGFTFTRTTCSALVNLGGEQYPE